MPKNVQRLYRMPDAYHPVSKGLKKRRKNLDGLLPAKPSQTIQGARLTGESQVTLILTKLDNEQKKQGGRRFVRIMLQRKKKTIILQKRGRNGWVMTAIRKRRSITLNVDLQKQGGRRRRMSRVSLHPNHIAGLGGGVELRTRLEAYGQEKTRNRHLLGTIHRTVKYDPA